MRRSRCASRPRHSLWQSNLHRPRSLGPDLVFQDTYAGLLSPGTCKGCPYISSVIRGGARNVLVSLAGTREVGTRPNRAAATANCPRLIPPSLGDTRRFT